MTQAQAEAHHDFKEGKNLILSGFAGTGKTYLACALAIEALLDGTVNKIIIFRSAVSSRDIGHLPGSEKEKLAVYESAIRGTINELLHRDDAYDILRQKGLIEFHSTSFMRGVTLRGAAVIVEEAQNNTFHETETLITRLHGTSRVILTGDDRQTDLMRGSGFSRVVRVAERIPKHFSRIDFGIDDIVRGPLVKAWIIASSESEKL